MVGADSHLNIHMYMKILISTSATNLFYEIRLENISRYPVNVVYGHPLVSNSNGKTKKDDKDVDYKSP